MNSIERERRGALRRVALLGPIAAAVLAGCNTSDGTIGIGGGQQPDPVALDFPIAYTKGPLFDEDMELLSNTDLRDVERFNIGTDLYFRDRASPTAVERNITRGETEGLGDVMGVEISADGRKLLFAMRGPFDPNADDEDQPTWNIWEYDIAAATLRRIIASDITAEVGHDIAPHYLADGRIIFSSTRQRTAKAILLDEGKPQFEAFDEDRDEPAFVLHVMKADGTDIRQVSFNQSNDLDPTLLDNGKVLFSRWDHAGSVNGIHLYTMNPDGSELELYYGAESHDTGTNGGQVQFVDARQMLDGRIMAVVRPFDHPELGGALTMIDAARFVENDQPLQAFAGMPGPAQTPATPNQVRTDLEPSPGGRFASAFPLWDGTNRVLTSWAICRVLEDNPSDPMNPRRVPCTPERLADPDVEVAPPLYGIWMYDPVSQTQLPIVIGEEGVLIGDAVAAQPRPNPAFIADRVGTADLIAEGVGIINIRSVYDIDGVASVNIAATADPLQTPAIVRPARFLRVEKAVSIPDDDIVDLDNTAFGPNIQQGMREIVAYAPIEPDGSVRVKVPANVALAVSVLDANGRRTAASDRHQNWLQVAPGQELTCSGCHDAQDGRSHGRAAAFASVYAGAAGNGLAFPNTRPTYWANFGETMAETRTRIDRTTDPLLMTCPPSALQPSVDVIFCDAWTDPMVATPAASFAYRYSRGGYQYVPGEDHGVPVPPLNLGGCTSTWTSRCRIVIHYETHVHPLWSAPRQVIDPMDGVTVLQDNTCSNSGCHAPTANNMTAVPAAQLDLTNGVSADEADHFNAYRELLFADNRQILVNNALQDEQIQVGVDAMGNPILMNVTVGASMSAAGARFSRFFQCFDQVSAVCDAPSHVGYLSRDELRMLAEWLDIGAQYYNDPFAVPVM